MTERMMYLIGTVTAVGPFLLVWAISFWLAQALAPSSEPEQEKEDELSILKTR